MERISPDMSEMDISSIEKTRKRLFGMLCISFSFPIILIFTIVDIFEGDTLETAIDILLIVFFVFCFLGIKKWKADLQIYRLGLALLSVIFLYNVSIGAGNETVVYWLYSFPIVFLFFLGKREGCIASILFFGILGLLLFNPFSLDIYSYSVGFSLRFLTSLLLVTLMAYGLEASREKYGNLLIEKNLKLLEEKKNLEHALGEIKTLTGLIPICANCKKVRNDEGYWQQVEVYVRDHSLADFSHSICPDCIEKLYPTYKQKRADEK